MSNLATALRNKRYRALDGTAMAADFLKQVGFKLAQASLSTDSCYYVFPGYWGTIRVATHGRKKEKRRGLHNAEDHKFGPVITRITFNEITHERQKLTEAYIESATATAIGRYFMQAKKLTHVALIAKDHPHD